MRRPHFPLRLSLVGAPLPSSHPATAPTAGPPSPPRSFPGAVHGGFPALVGRNAKLDEIGGEQCWKQ
ncbi:hypothetical protein C2845_PM12G15890 [Panicum miliaceum]|uniref:Uncharacterized protein n=1 Tax=Panicum miliaceum TaxID=4540 RepID=A0A3L6QDI8_PANMI|nr:hypothetical protein C2845_PM12G15890 [Panicum miliaceum]